VKEILISADNIPIMSLKTWEWELKQKHTELYHEHEQTLTSKNCFHALCFQCIMMSIIHGKTTSKYIYAIMYIRYACTLISDTDLSTTLKCLALGRIELLF